MTSKLTIEQAKRLRNDFECWQQDYDPKDDKEQYDMFGRGMVAMDMLIAGMYQEPVAYTDERNLGYIDRGRETAYLWGKQNSEASDVALYRHAQPAPVVPDKMTAIVKDEAEYVEGWNACRAAMLAAAPQSPGSEPATVPGKWIPVSERMPDVGVKVLCFPVKDEPIHATFNGQLWLQDVSWSGSDDTIDNVIPVSVTHWMPLPAAPQEVKGE